MKNTLITIFCFLLSITKSFSQTFFIEPTEKGFEKEIVSKLDFNGYKLSKSVDQSDFTIKHHYQKNSKNYKFEGYITIVNSTNGGEVYRTEIVKKPANAFNGYQAMPQVIAILVDKQLLPELKNNNSKYKVQ